MVFDAMFIDNFWNTPEPNHFFLDKHFLFDYASERGETDQRILSQPFLGRLT